MDILNDLTGGLFNKEDPEDANKTPYTLCIQFDDDEPILIMDEIESGKHILIEITNSNDEHSFLEFRCKTTGKKFKLYAK
jgi:hypothetical protein